MTNKTEWGQYLSGNSQSSEYVHLKGTSSILVGFCASSFFLALLDFSLHFEQFHPPFKQNYLAKNISISLLQSGYLSLSLSLPDTTDVERVTGDSQAAQYSLYWTSTLLHLLIIHSPFTFHHSLTFWPAACQPGFSIETTAALLSR